MLNYGTHTIEDYFMIKKIAAQDRHFNDFGWLKTYWLFSFSSYSDPKNREHGMLRVFNDDVVAPHSGFGTHPHEEMEIISIVLDGEMVHTDTMGNSCVIQKNDVQRMTAGTGLFHSERNESDRPVHFFQIWIRPDRFGLTPSYDQKSFSESTWHNTLAMLASSHPESGAVLLNTDASLYRGRFDRPATINYTVDRMRKLFLYVIEGKITLDDLSFSRCDQARISQVDRLAISVTDTADFLLIDIPENQKKR